MMTNEQLARVYMDLWFALRRTPCIVTVKGGGWFTVQHDPTIRTVRGRSVRASDLANGIAILAGRLAK